MCWEPQYARSYRSQGRLLVVGEARGSATKTAQRCNGFCLAENLTGYSSDSACDWPGGMQRRPILMQRITGHKPRPLNLVGYGYYWSFYGSPMTVLSGGKNMLLSHILAQSIRRICQLQPTGVSWIEHFSHTYLIHSSVSAHKHMQSILMQDDTWRKSINHYVEFGMELPSIKM